MRRLFAEMWELEEPKHDAAAPGTCHNSQHYPWVWRSTKDRGGWLVLIYVEWLLTGAVHRARCREGVSKEISWSLSSLLLIAGCFIYHRIQPETRGSVLCLLFISYSSHWWRMDPLLQLVWGDWTHDTWHWTDEMYGSLLLTYIHKPTWGFCWKIE